MLCSKEANLGLNPNDRRLLQQANGCVTTSKSVLWLPVRSAISDCKQGYLV